LNVVPYSAEAAQIGMAATIFHWGLHAWATYAVVGLALAFFAYNKGLPLALRSVFYPVLGERIWGWPGHIIDICAVLATAIGLATSLGLGAKQVSSGLDFLFGVDAGLPTQLVVIAGVSMAAALSVWLGLDRGIKILSNLNLGLAFVLLLFIVVFGPTTSLLKGIPSAFDSYFSNIFRLSNWIDRKDGDWYRTWTVFYWAWWISWSPFVGAFIARVSKGRTVREFITAVLILPALVCSVWMSVFGLTAISQAQDGIGQLANGLSDVSIALFHMLESLPLAEVTSILGIALVAIFFVTSADSGALVISIMTAGGVSDSTRKQHVFWAAMTGAIAATLLIGGGAQTLGALQSATIVASLPFALLMLLMCVSVYLGLRSELQQQ
jgi:BCCT family betaine/carnitine transporter